jgi:hypothetical protein
MDTVIVILGIALLVGLAIWELTIRVRLVKLFIKWLFRKR